MFESSRRGFMRVLGIGAAATAVPITAAAVEAKLAAGLAEGSTNPFHIPPEIIPKGVTYNWKRIFLDKDTVDGAHFADMMACGWKPVPFVRHKDYFKDRGFHNWIEVGGLVLMEKSTALTAAEHRRLADAALAEGRRRPRS